MARFLSPEWFEEVEREQSPAEGGRGLVVEILVSGAPQGEVRYQVVVDAERARVVAPGSKFERAQVQLRSDYDTVAGIASGRLSALEALSLGRARVGGGTGALYKGAPRLAELDLLPPSVRARTTY